MRTRFTKAATLRAPWWRTVLTGTCLLVCLAAPAQADIRVPDGVRVQRVASGIPHPSNLALDARGRLWVTSAGHQAAASDGVWLVRRRGARPRHVIRGRFSALGVLWHRGELYVSHVVPNRTFAPRHTGRVVAFSGFDGRRFRRSRVVVRGLPTGLHRVDSLAAGPDGRIHLGVGSQFDAQRSAHRLSGTVVSFRPRGGGLRIEARGLRNPYGLAFVPGTRRLLVSEHGRDDLGPDLPPEEVNLVRTGGRPRFYGFPECWTRCPGVEPPLVRMRAHSAPGVVAVAERFGRFGPSAFVARFGAPGDVVRIPLGAERPRARRFATGFGTAQALGLALGPRGALYVSRWSSGSVIRLLPEPPSLQPLLRIATTAGLGLLGLRCVLLSPCGHQDE